MNWPNRILMIEPIGFRISYAINPHMMDSSGQLKQVDHDRAQQQWLKLKATFEALGLQVETIKGDQQLPDMVFCANQTMPYLNSAGQNCWILSRMASKQRAPEVSHLRNWIQSANQSYTEMTDFEFEGCGDAIWDYEGKRLFVGHGFRSSPQASYWLAKIIEAPITSLELVSNHFYHLDTCFFVLNQKTCAFVPSAFSKESQRAIASAFENAIVIDEDEALSNFAGNAFCPDGKNVILQRGSLILSRKLVSKGFYPIEVDTSEFMKSGGSVFCMKQAYWSA